MRKALKKKAPLAGSVAAGMVVAGVAAVVVARRRARRSRVDRFRAIAARTSADIRERAVDAMQDARPKVDAAVASMKPAISAAGQRVAAAMPKLSSLPLARMAAGAAGLALLSLSSKEPATRGPSGGFTGLELLERALFG
jgi:hypothetical protein